MRASPASALDLVEFQKVAEKASDEAMVVFVVASLYRRMRSEHAALTHAGGVIPQRMGVRTGERVGVSPKQRDRQKRGVPIIQVEGVDF